MRARLRRPSLLVKFSLLSLLVIVAIGVATLILDLLLPKLDPRITYHRR